MTASNIGYRDRYYRGRLQQRQAEGLGLARPDSVELLLRLFQRRGCRRSTGSTVVFKLNDAAQSSVQNIRCPAVVGACHSSGEKQSRSWRRRQSIAGWRSQKSTCSSSAAPRVSGPAASPARENFNVNMTYEPRRREDRLDALGAASFAFNNANELALPLDNRTNDFGLAAPSGASRGTAWSRWRGTGPGSPTGRPRHDLGQPDPAGPGGLQQRPGAAEQARTTPAATATATARQSAGCRRPRTTASTRSARSGCTDCRQHDDQRRFTTREMNDDG